MNVAGRKFKVWEYHVSHPRLLIRSPGLDQGQKNIDIYFPIVEFVYGSFYLGEIEIKNHENETAFSLFKQYPLMDPLQSWALLGTAGTLLVCASGIEVEENDLPPFASTWFD